MLCGVTLVLGGTLQLHSNSGIGMIEFENTATATLSADHTGINSSVPITLNGAGGSACTLSAKDGALQTSCPLLAPEAPIKSTYHFIGMGFDRRYPCFGGVCHSYYDWSPEIRDWGYYSRSFWASHTPASSIESCARQCTTHDCNAFTFTPRETGQSEECMSNYDVAPNLCVLLFAANAPWRTWQFYEKTAYAPWRISRSRCARFLYTKQQSDPPPEPSSGEPSSGEPSSGEPSSGEPQSAPNHELSSGDNPPDVPTVLANPTPGVLTYLSGLISASTRTLRRQLSANFMGSTAPPSARRKLSPSIPRTLVV